MIHRVSITLSLIALAGALALFLTRDGGHCPAGRVAPAKPGNVVRV